VARRWIFLGAYTCSGFAGLIYQVSWTRLLTLTLGHTTAAASTVVAAFMGGLAIGAFAGGRVAKQLSPRAAIHMYAALEASVAVLALLVPYELGTLTPLLAWSYRHDASTILFPLVRVISSLVVVFIPALALGATFPAAIRAFVRDSRAVGSSVGALYAANTIGAALGAVLGGFVLIPALGIFGTTLIGTAAGVLSAGTAVMLARRAWIEAPIGAIHAAERRPISSPKKPRVRSQRFKPAAAVPPATWLAAVALTLTGFASLLCEIVWTRTFAMIIGPTTYAFAATVAAVITGLAIGAALGAWVAKFTIRPALWLAVTLAATAMAITVAASFAGGPLPRLVAHQLASASQPPTALLVRQSFVVAALILPAAVGFGAAFPLGLALLKATDTVADRVGTVYALNTMAAVAGSLVAGFVAIPLLGLQRSLWLAVAALVIDVVVIAFRGGLTGRGRFVGLSAAAVAAGVAVVSPTWDRDLLASGGYKYAPRVPKTVDLETALKAGTLLFYEEGAASTVSVKRLTGAISLSIDGKVDASSVGDMLTQKALAHLPLLLHENPREICIIGLGSGVTLASALTHGVERADVVEISTGVVRASQFFKKENRDALTDVRTHLIVGDGRSHLALTDRRYDVIISEPSNPWIAGVAALFTREFFTAARSRLAPHGIICQWAHTYDISADDF
jgi:spermidine synthase